MGRRKQTEPPIPATYLQECFAVDAEGQLIWRERPERHFPNRREDHANFNARFAGRPAGFKGPGGKPLVRLQHNGRTRRVVLLRIAWVLATGDLPRGAVRPRDGGEWNASFENLIETALGRNQFGGLSLAQRAASDAAVLAAMRDNPSVSVAQLSALVGSDKPCVCRRLAKLAEAGLTCGPMCVPSRHWHLTGKGAEIAASERPMLDDLDQAILRVIAQRDHIAAASVARRVEGTEMTARRRLRGLVERGLVSNGDGYSLTDAGRDVVGPRPEPWVKRLQVESVARRCGDDMLVGSVSIARFG